MDVAISTSVRWKRRVGVPKVKCWNLIAENATKLSEKIKMEGKWIVEGDANQMWEEMTECIRVSAKEVLGVSKEGGRMEGTWWWSEEVKEQVKGKQ